MKRFVLALCLAMAGGSGIGLAARPALAAGLCAGNGPGCFQTIQAALDAAHDGDVISIGPGNFAGGVSIDKSVSLVGAGAGRTVINGGGPVITIGHMGAPPEPTVSITGVTVTGGFNTSFPTQFRPFGGGILVLPATSGSTCNPFNPGECLGATVTIRDSVISGNRVTATASASCGNGCSFAVPFGGGIMNFGTMTLTDTTVSGNTVTNEASPEAFFDDGAGAGITSAIASALTLNNSTVDNNGYAVSATTAGFGIFVGAGGIDCDGAMTMTGSTVSGNTVSVTSTNPDTNMFGIGGGIWVEGTGTATIRGSTIAGNHVTTVGVGGGEGVGANASAGGIDDDGMVTLLGSSVRDNSISATITSSTTTSNAQSNAGGMEIEGGATIKDATFSGNRVSATSPAGVVNGDANVGAAASSGALSTFTSQAVTISDSVITGNSVRSTTTTGIAVAVGGAIQDCSSALTLRNTTVSNNSASVSGPPGQTAIGGGGIWNGDCGGGPPALALIDSTITHNSLTASAGTTPRGGGLWTNAPVTLTNTLIAQNVPDQCFGC